MTGTQKSRFEITFEKTMISVSIYTSVLMCHPWRYPKSCDEKDLPYVVIRQSDYKSQRNLRGLYTFAPMPILYPESQESKRRAYELWNPNFWMIYHFASLKAIPRVRIIMVENLECRYISNNVHGFRTFNETLFRLKVFKLHHHATAEAILSMCSHHTNQKYRNRYCNIGIQ